MVELLAPYKAYRSERGTDRKPLNLKIETEKGLLSVIFDMGLTAKDRELKIGCIDLSANLPLADAVDLFMAIKSERCPERGIYMREHWAYMEGLMDLGAEVSLTGPGNAHRLFLAEEGHIDKLAEQGFMINTGRRMERFPMHRMWTPESSSEESPEILIKRGSNLNHDFAYANQGILGPLFDYIGKVEVGIRKWVDPK